ncbi:MAG: hypothetical protein JW861_07040 [Bacteroidales bacterium]|nr:hypothetical protein [Bacteroidales bacterium]
MEQLPRIMEESDLLRLIRSSARVNGQLLGQLKFFREIVGKLHIAIFIHDLKIQRHI